MIWLKKSAEGAGLAACLLQRTSHVYRQDSQRGSSQIELLLLVSVIALGCVAAYHRFVGSVAQTSEHQGTCLEEMSADCGRRASGKRAMANAGIVAPTASFAAMTPADAPQSCAGGSCAGSNCFPAGTLVTTQDGLLPIEQVQIGMFVLAVDPEHNEGGYRRVVRTFVRQSTDLVEMRVEERGSAETLRATAEHPFFVLGRGWTLAAELAPGDQLASAAGVLRVESLATVASGRDPRVYNFEVEGTHTYAVGTLRTVTHNACGFRVPTDDAVDTAVKIEACLTGAFSGAAKALGAKGITEEVLKKALDDAVQDAQVGCAKSVAQRLGPNPEKTTLTNEVNKCIDAATAKMKDPAYWADRLKTSTGEAVAAVIAPPFVAAVNCAVAAGMIMGLGYDAIHIAAWGKPGASWESNSKDWKARLEYEKDRKIEVWVLDSNDGRVRVEFKIHTPGPDYPDKRKSYDARIKYDGKEWSDYQAMLGQDPKYDEWIRLRPNGKGSFEAHNDGGGNYVKLTPSNDPAQPWKVEVSQRWWWSWTDVSGVPKKVRNVPLRIWSK